MAHYQDMSKTIKSLLDSKMAIGQSRHLAKDNGTAQDKIFSYGTRHTYETKCNQFANYCKDNYNCKSLTQCEKHINDYMQHIRDKGQSAYTQKATLSAIGKLYGKSYFNEVKTDARHREDINNNRTHTEYQKHFSEKNNQELVNFCKNTGLRRSELLQIKGNSLVFKDGKYQIYVENGKGGKERYVPILNQNKQTIDKMLSVKENQNVWLSVSKAAPIHQYRAEFAQNTYRELARETSTLKSNELYYCRGTMAGQVYDKVALHETSQALGHERENVIVSHYLR